jgi:hypothetical protein
MPQDCDVDRLLTDHPNILAMDVPALFEDLRAVFPTRDPADVLRANPKIAYQVRRRSATRNFFFRACVSFFRTAKTLSTSSVSISSRGVVLFVDAKRTASKRSFRVSGRSPNALFVRPDTQLEKNTPSAWPLR